MDPPVAEVEGRHSQLSGQQLDDTVTTDAAIPEMTTLDDRMWTAGDEMAALLDNGREAVELMDRKTTRRPSVRNRSLISRGMNPLKSAIRSLSERPF